ncbi:hypothetical protein FDI69_gp025 [Rhodococcus phage Trina]|uniref:Uncharacterized protein n=1 Tax=Rhodococcus phage Trina TaxID=2027905 RepID=A0A2D1A1X8_9CAUD|nr:hypothetical protein FDI69_gp025 [Rhodococcus phage Trina]ASZ74842.1 hypothetical protein SEA_TRINA_25 [Rhodococcus phage Trina]
MSERDEMTLLGVPVNLILWLIAKGLSLPGVSLVCDWLYIY